MKDAVTSKPAILIDLKKYRIRIHKNTLYLLGNPEYIMFLVNPSDRIIAIRCGTKSDRYAHRITGNQSLIESPTNYIVLFSFRH